MEEHLERRQWPRLELPIPMFVRANDAEGCAFTELTMALNISSGGALVALRRAMVNLGTVTLEIPRPPIPDQNSLPLSAPHTIEAKIVRIEHSTKHQLLGLQFLEPLAMQAAAR